MSVFMFPERNQGKLYEEDKIIMAVTSSLIKDFAVEDIGRPLSDTELKAFEFTIIESNLYESYLALIRNAIEAV